MSGWTVADTSKLAAAAATAPPPPIHDRQQSSSGGALRQQQHQQQHHVRWSDSYRSQSEEDLDKLLDGLDKLTETLPDLDDDGGGRSGHQYTKTQASRQRHTSQPSSISDRNKLVKQGGQQQRQQQHLRPNGSTPHQRQQREVNVNNETIGSAPSPYRQSVPSSSLLSPSAPFSSASSPSTSSVRSPAGRRDDATDAATTTSEDAERSISPAAAVFPSVRKKRQDLLLSRDNYSAAGSDYAAMETETNGHHGHGSTTHATRQPYHTLHDSKPFSYIHANNGHGSRPVSRASSREALGHGQTGLQSPSLLRRILSNVDRAGNDSSDAEAEPRPESPLARKVVPPAKQQQEQPQQHKRQESNNNNNSDAYHTHTSTRVIPIEQTPPKSVVTHHHINVSGSNNGFHATPSKNDDEPSLSWLERQQIKLHQKREVEHRRNQRVHPAGHVPSGDFMMRELKSSLQREHVLQQQQQQQQHAAKSETTTDGYASDLASMLYSEPSSTRESSPHKQQQQHSQPVYHVPLKVETGDYQHQQRQEKSRDQGGIYQQTQHKTQDHSNIYQQTQHKSHDTSIYQQSQSRTPTLSRQRSDSSYDRSRPFISRRLRHDSESEAELAAMMMNPSSTLRSKNGLHASNSSIDSAFHMGGGYGSRPITPAFPASPGTPYFNQSAGRGNYTLNNGKRAPSPSGSLYQQTGDLSSRRGSLSSEPAEVSSTHVKLVKDHFKHWYKPNISREEAIAMLRNRRPGSFVVRDSNSFPGAFGLALKVDAPPANAQTTDLVRHFLIEPTSKGVKLKGYNNEPVFASLSALVYQHTVTQLALPTKLVLPQGDPAGESSGPGRDSLDSRTSMGQLLALGAACNVLYLFSYDTDTLTGPAAVKRAVGQLFAAQPKPRATLVHFKVSGQGITLTDNTRRLFFRKHYSTPAISFCGIDPEDRRWKDKPDPDDPARRGDQEGVSYRVFAFVARRASRGVINQCHVFAEHDSDQPARAIVNFVNKVMLSGNNARAEVV